MQLFRNYESSIPQFLNQEEGHKKTLFSILYKNLEVLQVLQKAVVIHLEFHKYMVKTYKRRIK